MGIAMIVGRALGPTSGWISETVVMIFKMHGMEFFWTKVRHMPQKQVSYIRWSSKCPAFSMWMAPTGMLGTVSHPLQGQRFDKVLKNVSTLKDNV
jgi:hypothetical protein